MSAEPRPDAPSIHALDLGESTVSEPRRVQITTAGPILVEGPVRIETPGGDTVESDRFMVAICTCRRSKTYPLCDTSHRKRRRRSDDSAGQS